MNAHTTDPDMILAAKLAGAIVGHMALEAAYRGVPIGPEDIANCLARDPDGNTACYFRRSAEDVVALVGTLRETPELLQVFGTRPAGVPA
ncbi:MAG: hypothetical protein J0I01_05840 [Stenotrophomonas nitritireducens]|uniref:hypothetical protein n=1 Tax=Stenotrophomonas nitritireducens TaxID=83617 RepID=UPI001ACDB403|nr:hypothetical protein [Stenotrophomonas nitritireducens]MBN8791733.1 hypothetical protein [Stenotrophomonas nitritireducens]MBN8795671.1 hypothetical protein [Stenotrophomonas nitritireducens]